VDADSTRSGAFVKMSCDRFGDLLLQIAEVLPLRRDATGSIRIIPRCHEPARLLVTLDLKGNFFHYLEPINPYARCSSRNNGATRWDHLLRTWFSREVSNQNHAECIRRILTFAAVTRVIPVIYFASSKECL
jgi:hypothetical protein